MATDPPDDLDALLGAWGRRQRLPGTEVEAVRAFVVAQPRGLPATWWGAFSSQVSNAVVQAAGAGASVAAPGPRPAAPAPG